MNGFVFGFAALVASATTIVAQGVLPLDQSMRIGAVGTGFAGACGWSMSPTTFADEGTVVLLPDGTCTVQVMRSSVCPGGLVLNSPPETGAGTYQVGTDGTLTLRWLPAQPGVEDDTVMLRADGSVFVRTRYSDRSDESVLMIGIALSSGKNSGSLNGSYRVVRLLQRNPATGFVLQGDLGTIQFDGMGGYVDQGTRHVLDLGGVGTTSPYGPLNGTYTVSPDGTVVTAVGAQGAVSADGEVFFWVRHAGTDISMTIGLRQAAVYGAAMASGAWRIAGMQDAIGSGVPMPECRTDWGAMSLQSSGGGIGVLGLDVMHVVTTSIQTTGAPSITNDAFTFSPQGDLTLLSGSPTPMPGVLGADGRVLAALALPGDSMGLMVGMAAARWPTPFGTPTAGSGGVAPVLFPVGGFPHAGNGDFGVIVARGLGGALSGVVFSGGVSTGLPLFGGLVWIDPGLQFGSVALLLSGTLGQPAVGAALIPLPLPPVPEFAGMRLACQGFTLDPAAPQGIAMSRALDTTICR